MHGIVLRRRVRPLVPFDAPSLRLDQLEPKRGGDAAGHLVVQGRQVVAHALEPFGPELGPAARVDQPGIDVDLIFAPPTLPSRA